MTATEKRKAYAREYAREWRLKNPDMAQNNELKRHYGITLEDYRSLLAEQGGGCAICGALPGTTGSGNSSKGTLAVDHCHDLGIVRGILCTNCNLGLGSFFDKPELLVAAATYLQDFKDLVERIQVRKAIEQASQKDFADDFLQELQDGP